MNLRERKESHKRLTCATFTSCPQAFTRASHPPHREPYLKCEPLLAATLFLGGGSHCPTLLEGRGGGCQKGRHSIVVLSATVPGIPGWYTFCSERLRGSVVAYNTLVLFS